MKKYLISFLLLILCGLSYAQNIISIESLVEKGELSVAKSFIKSELVNNDTLSQAGVKHFKEELSRIEAIIDNYPHTYDEMFTELKKMIPDLTKKDIEKWEKDTSLEYRVIDGQKMYIGAFWYNLFALSKEAEERRIKNNNDKNDSKIDYTAYYIKQVINEAEKSDSEWLLPKRIKVNFLFFVDVTGIPEGEIIRGWLPIPTDIRKQQNIIILDIEPEQYIISNKGEHLNSSIYVEKPFIKNDPITEKWLKWVSNPDEKWIKPTPSLEKLYQNKDVVVFRVLFEYTSFAYCRNIDPKDILPYDKSSPVYTKYTKEEPNEIEFTDYLIRLSEQIVQDETNPYLKAKRIYEWVTKNVVWTDPDYASPNLLSDNIAKMRRGDCGGQALLFVALCRLNGIPARFQGGWKIRPRRDHAQHGWAQMYMEPYGWMSVDPTFGAHLIDSEVEKFKYAYFGNIDPYRLIIYDDVTPLYPLKVYGGFSSCLSGLQLGAFEWSGGGLSGANDFNVKIDTEAEE